MSTARLVFVVIAFNAPLGLVAGIIPLVIAFGPGLGTPYLFLGFGALLAVFAVGYGLMSRTLKGAGAYYTFVTAGLGRVPGLASSFLALLTYSCGILSILVFAGISGQSLLASVGGPDISWWIWSLVIAIGVGILGYFRIDFSTKVLVVVVTLEVALVIVYNIVVASKGGATGALQFSSFNPDSLTHGGVAVGVVFALIAFGGFESTAIFRNEVRSPEKTIPRATYIAIAIIAVFYSITSWILIQAFGEENAVFGILSDPTSAFLGTLGQFMGRVAFDVAAILVLTSSFASVAAMHNVISRYVFNLGGDGVFPKKIGTPHPRLNSPHRASLIFSTVTLAFLAVCVFSSQSVGDVYALLAGASGFSLSCLLFLASIAIPCYLIRNKPAGASVWQTTIAPIFSMVVLGVLLVVVTINVDLLTGSAARSYLAMGAVVVALVVGGLLALVLRSIRPDVYRRIGSQQES